MTGRAAGRGTWLRAVLLLLALLALGPPASAALRTAHPASGMTATDCAAGHGEGAPDTRHADLCCAFHCAPAVPLAAPAMRAPLAAGLLYERHIDAGLREVGRRVPVPPPRRA